mmetsp:Transcript_11634/g.17653  ORF Transcript_11634/g.17653 Transcript_11634/m.17653 type:complete len:236 (+) Transcript_11634:90-797(+)
MFLVTTLTTLFAIINGVVSHPDRYTSSLKDTVDCDSYPTIMSYHVHITYMLTNKDQIKRAGELREEALVVFADLLGEDPVCRGTSNDPSGRYDNGELCMIYDHELDVTLGPFPVGEWSMFVPVHYYNRVVPWYVQHRGEFSLLVHPNTGCEYEDHSIWAQWSGDKWNLDMSIFTPHTQTESFNQTLGTPENPSCQPRGQVCAAGNHDSPGFAPQIVCCEGMSCSCGSKEGVCYCE